MKKTETQQLLETIAAIDNRKITPATLDAWFEVVKHIPLEIALEAHLMARRAESVGYLEPKHIIAYSREAAYALDRAKPKPVEPQQPYNPQPKCRDHGKTILECGHCARRIWKYSEKATAEQTHQFAITEIYE
jgi:hypothetical protein